MSVTAVTVTYGSRLPLLVQVLDALRAQGVREAIVVDNAAADPLSVALPERYGDWAVLHRLPKNLGSAAGFKAGIEQALARDADNILLVDDDNVPDAGCVARLTEALRIVAGGCGRDRAAVCAFRADRHQRAANRPRSTRVRSSFRGSHVLDIPAKIFSRLRAARPVREDGSSMVPINWATYGGLLFHRGLIGTIGLPRQDFCLYADDFEFTYRIKKAGGTIMLVPDARLTDIETSWHIKDKPKSALSAIVSSGSDFRVYYSFRNGVYFDYHCLEANRAVLVVNTMFTMAMLIFLALIKRRASRAGLLLRAMRDGIRGHLGVNARYPIGS
jgi:GT2 family glycosyltransferase